jgi:dTDP-4-dehydrorhamnose reductase
LRIVVTGGPGQLVLSLIERGAARTSEAFEIVAVGPPELDLAFPDDDRILAALAAASPDVIVNAAAHTAVDKAETERELAFAINAEGAGAVARAAARLGVPLVHVSTDYVFAGDKLEPYTENDVPAPTGVYGASKLAGEAAVLASGADAAILRTAWVYSPFGANFVKTMLRLAETREELGVVADQRGNPTNALDLADAVLTVATNLTADAAPQLRGLFHATGSGEASWADFAEAIFAASAAQGGRSARVKPITSAEYPTPARRPANSRLDCSRLAQHHGVRLPDWHGSTRAVVARLVQATVEGAHP